jgi:DNA polymerase III delta subunit
MLIILHGSDTFRSRQKLKKLQKTYLEKNKGFGYEMRDAADLDFRELKNILESQSLFAQKRFIVVENISENKNLLQHLQTVNYKLPTANNIVVFYERGNISKNSDYKKLFKQADRSQEFKKLSLGEAVNYFVKLFPEIEMSIIKQVLLLCQPSDWTGRKAKGAQPDTMWQAYNELSKLQNYKGGALTISTLKIKEEDLQKLKIGKQDAQIFPLIDAIFGRDADRAFHNLLLHWCQGARPEFVFYMIEQQLKNIVLVKEALESGRASVSELDLHYFVIQKASALADKFSWQKIKTLYKRVEALDLKIKSGQVPAQLACELLSAAILK